jgi:hypothetical protein
MQLIQRRRKGALLFATSYEEWRYVYLPRYVLPINSAIADPAGGGRPGSRVSSRLRIIAVGLIYNDL